MAVLTIHEYKADENNPPIEPPLVAQTPLTISGTSGQSSAFAGDTKWVRLSATGACYVLFGTNPTAVTASSVFLASGVRTDFAVPMGSALKVAVVT